MTLNAVMPILNAQTRIIEAQKLQSEALQEIASGLKSNVNPADYYISQGLETDIRAAQQAMENAQYGQNVTSSADSSLQNISQSLQRINELATQAANGTYSDEQRAVMQKEIDQNVDQIKQTFANAQFNGKQILNVTYAGGPQAQNINFQIGTDSSSDSIVAYNPNVNVEDELKFDVSTPDAARASMQKISALSSNIDAKRGEIGAVSARIDSAINQQMTNLTSATQAKVSVAETDYASAIVKLTQSRITTQSLVEVMKASLRSERTLMQLLQ